MSNLYVTPMRVLLAMTCGPIADPMELNCGGIIFSLSGLKEMETASWLAVAGTVLIIGKAGVAAHPLHK